MFNGNLKDFHERQNAFLQKQQENRQKAANKFGDGAQCTFKPEINLTSEIICESDPQRGLENQEDRFQRLYEQDRQKIQVVKEMKEQEVYGQYTF